MGDGGGDAWLRRFEGEPGPLYMRLLAALERAIGEGELQPGDQLPSVFICFMSSSLIWILLSGSIS